MFESKIANLTADDYGGVELIWDPISQELVGFDQDSFDSLKAQLSKKAKGTLARKQIYSAEDLARYSSKQILNFPGFSSKELELIEILRIQAESQKSQDERIQCKLVNENELPF